MSHFLTYVFSKNNDKDYEELLEPYCEQIEYPPYVKYTRKQAIAKIREEIEEYKNTTYAEYLSDKDAYERNCPNKDHIHYLETEFPRHLAWSDEECYEDMKRWFDDDMVSDNGDLLSTYNPNSKWDWYEVGGRWNLCLCTADGTLTNEDYSGQINWNESELPFAYVDPVGAWHERGNMGWWATVSNEKDLKTWEREFKEFVKKLDKDVVVIAVDCHI